MQPSTPTPRDRNGIPPQDKLDIFGAGSGRSIGKHIREMLSPGRELGLFGRGRGPEKGPPSQLEILLGTLEQRNDPFWAQFGHLPTERGLIMQQIADLMPGPPEGRAQIPARAESLLPQMGKITWALASKKSDSYRDLLGELGQPKDESEMLARTFALLLTQYGDEMRENRRMHAVCHSLRVGLRIAILTNDALYTIWALTHDLKEDRNMTARQLDEIIGPRAGEMLDALSNLYRHSLAGWRRYMRALLASTLAPAIVIKVYADTPENLWDLKGCSEGMVLGTTQKGIGGAYVARKIHPELLRMYCSLLKQNGHASLQGRADLLLVPSKSQREAEERGFKDDLASRQPGLSFELFGTVPDAGTRVIGVTDDGIILLPFISGLSKRQAARILDTEFAGLGVEWRLEPSFFPTRLQYYHIAVPKTNPYAMTEPGFRSKRIQVIERLPGAIFPDFF